ncbi:MAG TPA: choice-of-anchor tandem repeat GloVer-containing protein [Bryobacteraceae bacterium]|nr:choice-of-anchor tandem repeat GloVer-containing protein [Bryobacteraceae bacterium]
MAIQNGFTLRAANRHEVIGWPPTSMCASQPRTGSARSVSLWIACALSAITLAQAQTATEIVLHNFASPPDGSLPNAVYRDAAGNLYGTAYQGGASNAGVVFRLDAAGQQTWLYSFTGGADGRYPEAGVIGDAAGNLYGTTYEGGAAQKGVVYKIDTSGHETVLYSFTGGADGGNPEAGLILDSAGNLYGTTYRGGAKKAGAVYKLDTTGQETVLHSFTGGADGVFPQAGVIRDSTGNLYGTASQGGATDAGVVYMLDTAGNETVLYSFTGGADGRFPYAGVIRDSAGNLYGTTNQGGSSSAGVVYKLDTAGHQTVLYTFTGGGDGGYPSAGVIGDSDGNLYGTASGGGPDYCCGVVYKLDAAGHETVLYSFTEGAERPYGAEGGYPLAGVIRDSAGNLYGSTDRGGAADSGVVFKLDTSGHETVLASFPGPSDGSFPTAGVTGDSAGNLYGTTSSGNPVNAGVVYELDSTGNETLLYSFTGGDDGAFPGAGVIRDPAGNLYGTTTRGGTGDQGVVFKLDTAGNETVLYSFTGGTDGANPYFAGVIRDPAGNLYGTTGVGGDGGIEGVGVVYKLDTAGNETVLHSFTDGADGANPYTGVIRDAAGNLYGTTGAGGTANAGVVFKLDTAGNYTLLYSFMGLADGGNPNALTLDPSGNLYGTTYRGGTANRGVVYELGTAGNFTVLYSFTGADGAYPYAGVIRDSSGNLYGTTELGGAADAGVVYKLDTAGNFTVLYSFAAGAHGGSPESGLTLDSAGNLYGTTYLGGKHSTGIVFKIEPSGSAQTGSRDNRPAGCQPASHAFFLFFL